MTVVAKRNTGAKAAATPGLLSGASTYLMIRALSMPTFLLMGVLQSALLGMKDSVTPLKAILYSTIVNVLGDFFLVSHLGMGLKGAAIATTAAQWAATLGLLIPARKKLMEKGSLGLLNFRDKSAVTVQKFLLYFSLRYVSPKPKFLARLRFFFFPLIVPICLGLDYGQAAQQQRSIFNFNQS